ncbi:4496_t:CDS:1, partial [Gigaspora rosea]
MGYTKKALNYAVRADNVDELVSYLERFIEKMKIELDEQQESVENTIIGDPIRVKHKERQPKRYKSGGEDLPKKKIQKVQDMTNASEGSSNLKRIRHCQNCGQA